MAYSMDTAELQRISQEMLELYIYDPKTLRKDCPLDHGRRNLNDVKYDLGALLKLPLELRHAVLDKLDVQSLLDFRRASKAAMVTVNNMVSYQKVIISAPDCIRCMAVAIETSHTFTLAQLVAKLAQIHCDGINCTKLAPYIDVFTLTRRCLSTSRGCPCPCPPLNISYLEDQPGFNDIHARLQSKRRFAALAGRYDDEWRMEGKPIDEDEDDEETYHYSFEDIKEEFLSPVTQKFFSQCERGLSGKASLMWGWKLCSVMAPWLKEQVGMVETGVFCDECECVERYGSAALDDHDGPGWPPSIRWMIEGRWYVTEEHPEIVWPDPMSVPFMRVQDLEEHRTGEHFVAEGVSRDPEDYDWEDVGVFHW